MERSLGYQRRLDDHHRPAEAVLDFSPAYYNTPAQMTATTASGITTLDGLAGKTVCVGSATTYMDWLQGNLQSVSLGPVATPPAGVKVQTLDTDQLCAQAITAGRKDAEGFLSSASTTVDQAIANGTGRQGRRSGLHRAAGRFGRQERPG